MLQTFYFTSRAHSRICNVHSCSRPTVCRSQSLQSATTIVLIQTFTPLVKIHESINLRNIC